MGIRWGVRRAREADVLEVIYALRAKAALVAGAPKGAPLVAQRLGASHIFAASDFWPKVSAGEGPYRFPYCSGVSVVDCFLQGRKEGMLTCLLFLFEGSFESGLGITEPIGESPHEKNGSQRLV